MLNIRHFPTDILYKVFLYAHLSNSIDEMPLIGQEQVWNNLISILNTSCHIFLTGMPGCGKTAIIREFLSSYSIKTRGTPELKDCLVLGPEQDRGIQTIRGQISLFIRHIPDDPTIYKWVIIDDVDTFPHISQQALRRPMELYINSTRFIFIGPSYDDLIPALRSRCIHIKMNVINNFYYRNQLLSTVLQQVVPHPDMASVDYNISDEMWYWILSVSSNNTGRMIIILKMLCDIVRISGIPVSLDLIKTVCSVPSYIDYLPLLDAIYSRNTVSGANLIVDIWRKGYTFEDIIDSIQSTHSLFGSNDINNSNIVHNFLVSAWISYCKGFTSLIALQHIFYKTVTQYKPLSY